MSIVGVWVDVDQLGLLQYSMRPLCCCMPAQALGGSVLLLCWAIAGGQCDMVYM